MQDLFGRKVVLLSALVLLSLSDLACGLSVNSTMLYGQFLKAVSTERNAF